MQRKPKNTDKEAPEVGYRRRSQIHRNLEEPIEESPETLEKAVGKGQRIPAEKDRRGPVGGPEGRKRAAEGGVPQ
jgi:hypothetical protein